VRVQLDSLSGDRLSITPSPDWTILKLVVKTAASYGYVVRLLNKPDQGFEHLKQLMLVVKSSTPCVACTVIRDKQEIFSAIKALN
jgi:hypothetical protein